jgi:hypothetical protein
VSYKVVLTNPVKAYFREALPIRDRQHRLHFFGKFYDDLRVQAEDWRGMRTPGAEDTFQWAMRYDLGSELQRELACEALLFTFQISDQVADVLEVRAVEVKEIRRPFPGS